MTRDPTCPACLLLIAIGLFLMLSADVLIAAPYLERLGAALAKHELPAAAAVLRPDRR